MSILLNKQPIEIKDFKYFNFDLINKIDEEISNDFNIQGKTYNKQNKYVKTPNITSYNLSTIVNKDEKLNLFETIYSNNFFWIDTKKSLGKVIKQSSRLDGIYKTYLIIEGLDLVNSFPFDSNNPDYNKESLYIMDEIVNGVYEVESIKQSIDPSHLFDTEILLVENYRIDTAINIDLVGSNITISDLVYNTSKEYTLNMINEDKFNLSLNVNSINYIIENEVFKEKYDYTDNFYINNYIDNKHINNTFIFSDENNIKTCGDGFHIKTYDKTNDIFNYKSLLYYPDNSSSPSIKNSTSSNKINQNILNYDETLISGSDSKLRLFTFDLKNEVVVYDSGLITTNEIYSNSSTKLISYIEEDLNSVDNNTIYLYNSTDSKNINFNLFNKIEFDFTNNVLISNTDITPVDLDDAFEVFTPVYVENSVIFNKYQKEEFYDDTHSIYSPYNNQHVELNNVFHPFFSDISSRNTYSSYFDIETETYIVYFAFLDSSPTLNSVIFTLDSDFDLIDIRKDTYIRYVSAKFLINNNFIYMVCEDKIVKYNLDLTFVDEIILPNNLTDPTMSIYKNELRVVAVNSSTNYNDYITVINLDNFTEI